MNVNKWIPQYHVYNTIKGGAIVQQQASQQKETSRVIW